jgi:hypothetical protein
VVTLPAGANEEAVANALARRPDVAFAELDRIVPPSVIPNDPYGDSQRSLLCELGMAPPEDFRSHGLEHDDREQHRHCDY